MTFNREKFECEKQRNSSLADLIVSSATSPCSAMGTWE